MAYLESGLISERTKAGMAAKRAAEGRETWSPANLVIRGAGMPAAEPKAAGVSLAEIGRTLSDEGWMTSTGRDLWPEPPVRSALRVARFGALAAGPEQERARPITGVNTARQEDLALLAPIPVVESLARVVPLAGEGQADTPCNARYSPNGVTPRRI